MKQLSLSAKLIILFLLVGLIPFGVISTISYLFLFNPDGYAFYTVAQKADYKTNFVNGKYADSGLGNLVRTVLSTKQYGLANFASYTPDNGDPCAFIAQPVVFNDKVEMKMILKIFNLHFKT